MPKWPVPPINNSDPLIIANSDQYINWNSSKALYDFNSKNLDGAILHYGHAIEFQENLNYTEPPDWSHSMRLYLGAALLEADRAPEAEEVYRKDLEWNQRNGWTTFGLYQALEAQGKEQEAIVVNRQFEELWRNADIELERSRL